MCASICICSVLAWLPRVSLYRKLRSVARVIRVISGMLKLSRAASRHEFQRVFLVIVYMQGGSPLIRTRLFSKFMPDYPSCR